MNIDQTLSGRPLQFSVSFSTTPQTLRTIIGDNQIGPIGNRIPLGAKIHDQSGDMLWGVDSAGCVITATAALKPWNEPIANCLDLFFRASAGTVTGVVVLYFS
jgi:hypothetical protein